MHIKKFFVGETDFAANISFALPIKKVKPLPLLNFLLHYRLPSKNFGKTHKKNWREDRFRYKIRFKLSYACYFDFSHIYHISYLTDCIIVRFSFNLAKKTFSIKET